MKEKQDEKFIKISLRTAILIVSAIIIMLCIIFCVLFIVFVKKENTFSQTSDNTVPQNSDNVISKKSNTVSINKNWLNHFHVEFNNNKEYYIIDDDYSGEYQISNVDLTNKNDDVYNFSVEKIMNFYEYSDFFDKWNLDKKYSDENSNYIVFSYYAKTDNFAARLAGVTFDNNTATLYVWDETSEPSSQLLGYVIVVPVDHTINSFEIQELYDSSFYNSHILKHSSTENISENFEKFRHTYTEKPIIYLYPEETTELSVTLGKPENITCSYPQYDEDGWQVVANPDGTLIDKDTGRSLYALYWEGISKRFAKFDDGFVVKREDTIDFLEEKLAILGLNEREAEEFIVYWLPKLQENEYNLIRFESMDEINKNMPLNFSVQPDSVIRVMMDWKGLDKPINVKEQVLTTPERKGFVAVEWGGSEIK